MGSDGRNITVEALNERRLEAVRLRLSGLSVEEAAHRTNLSTATVISAMKAYRRGGWTAVPVAARGRGIRKQPDPNIKHFVSAPAVGSVQAVQMAPQSGPQAKLSSPAHLRRLEAESIHILREVVAEAKNPVMLYSIGKDSSVMLHLARKAFFPGAPPFPLMHIDTTWKFRDMYAFRDRMVRETGIQLIVYVNQEGIDMGINPFVHGSEIHTHI